MAIATADKNAFDAYNVLYYPLFGKQGLLNIPDTIASKSVPSLSDYAYAITAQENLNGTPYRLSERAIAALAKYHAIMDHMFNVSANPGVAAAMLIDPAADIRSFMPEPGRPMYPNFPAQVLEMDEHDYRVDQARHYMSTYGTKLFGRNLDASVGTGWLPETPQNADPKQLQDAAGVSEHIVDIAFSAEEINVFLDIEFSRPKRMPVPALRLAAHQMVTYNYVPETISFHENMMELIANSSDNSSSEIAQIMTSLCQHPGDLFKSVIWTAAKRQKPRLSTKMKKAYCQALETFESKDIARNLVDNGKAVRRSSNMLSVQRFAGPNLTKAVYDVEKGAVRSWNSQLEELWTKFKDAPSESTSHSLLAFYEQRPGIMLRSVGRLVSNDVPRDDIADALRRHGDDFSLATLVSIQTVMSSLDAVNSRDWSGRYLTNRSDESFADKQALHAIVASLTLPVLMDRLAKVETPLRMKKVWIDTCGFSLSGSVIMPNEVGNTGSAYPPAGMAYDVPADGTVRFFTFWDDRRKNVDVDLHFHAEKTDGSYADVGWNTSYKSNGMVTSGDITSSVNSAEYLDINMREALEAGVSTVFQNQHIYSGAADWADIATCFSGALVVPDTDPTYEIYSSENVLFHDDMTGQGNSMDYAMIDVPGHFVRIMRGMSLPFRHNGFTLELYVNLLLRSQGCTLVESKEDAEIVLAIGRSEDKEAISLIDNAFFIE